MTPCPGPRQARDRVLRYARPSRRLPVQRPRAEVKWHLGHHVYEGTSVGSADPVFVLAVWQRQ
jgi:hypothetical protein